MKNTQRGFIPLIAIIILGLTAVAGGTVAVISLQDPEPVPEAVVENDDFNTREAVEVKESEDVVEVTQEPEEKKEETLAVTKPAVEPPKDIEVEEVEIEIDPETTKICADVSNLLSSKDDIAEDLIELCDLIAKRDFDDEAELKSIQAKIENKWEIWEEVKSDNESAELERKLNEIEENLKESDDPEPETSQEQVDTEPTEEQVVEDAEPELSYNDLHCPTVVSLEDNQGNKSKTGLNYLKGTLSVSEIDTLQVTINAQDPNGDAIEYRFSPSSFSKNNPNLNQWTSSNLYEIKGENLLIGGNRTLFAAMDDGDEYSCIGANYDVSIKFTYDITP